MTVGAKIKKFRTERELSQKQLAIMSGMSEPAIRNYELGNRQPSAKQLEKIAGALSISSFALSNPDLESDLGVMHALFALEDMYGLQISELDGTVCLHLDTPMNALSSRFRDWKNEADKFKREEISIEEYDQWRHSYPNVEVERQKQRRDELRRQRKASESE